MRLQDIPEDIEPRVGDIIEIEQDDVCFEVRIIGITADGYLCEQDNVQGAILLEGVALDHSDVADISGYITEERVRLDPKCWKGKKIGNPKTKIKGGVRVNNCVPEGQEDIEESGLQYYTGVKKHGEKYMKLAAKAGREGASQEELGRLRDRYSKAEKTKESVEQDVAEAGPFSYGYKKPRKGSVAYWAEKKRKEQEKGKPPIEPKDQMVGVAKVTKGVAEGSDKLQGTPVVSLKDLGDKDTKKDRYGRTVPKKLKKDDPRVKFHKDEKQGVAEGEGKTQKYEMMMRNGQVKKFVAKDDADAKRIAAGHGAKSVIRLKGGVPAGKVAEQGVAEGKSLKKRVRVVQGEHAGKTGWIREIKHGIHSTAPKRYYVDIDGGGQADNLPASALRLLKNQSDSQTGMAEGGHDDQFSLSGRMPATDRIPQDSTAGQDKMQAMVAQMKQRTIDSILDEKPEWERSDLELMTAAELNQILRDIQSGKMTEAEYQGRKVPLGKPMAGDVKKSKVYVRKPNGKVVKVNFGDKKMKIKKSNPKRRKSFRARHNCENPGPRWKARYWSCRAW